MIFEDRNIPNRKNFSNICYIYQLVLVLFSTEENSFHDIFLITGNRFLKFSPSGPAGLIRYWVTHYTFYYVETLKIYMKSWVRLALTDPSRGTDFDAFWTSYTHNYKNTSRNDMRTSNTAFESWEFIFSNAKIFNVLRTHPEELYAFQNT